MQQLFRDWHALDQTQYEGVSVLSKQLKPYIGRRRRSASPATTRSCSSEPKQKIETIKALAVWIFHKAARNLPDPPDENVGDQPVRHQPEPENGRQDGLFSDDGMTLAQALEQLPGIEEMDLEARGAVVA